MKYELNMKGDGFMAFNILVKSKLGNERYMFDLVSDCCAINKNRYLSVFAMQSLID